MNFIISIFFYAFSDNIYLAIEYTMDTTRNAFISATSLAPISESEDEIIVSTTLYQNFDETRFYSLQNQSSGDMGNYSRIDHQVIEDCIGIVMMETVNRD